MSNSDAANHVLARFVEKCRVAGGAKAGYVMRRGAIDQGWDSSASEAMDSALSDLVAGGFLMANEAGDRYILTEQGVERIVSG